MTRSASSDHGPDSDPMALTGEKPEKTETSIKNKRTLLVKAGGIYLWEDDRDTWTCRWFAGVGTLFSEKGADPSVINL